MANCIHMVSKRSCSICSPVPDLMEKLKQSFAQPAATAPSPTPGPGVVEYIEVMNSLRGSPPPEATTTTDDENTTYHERNIPKRWEMLLTALKADTPESRSEALGHVHVLRNSEYHRGRGYERKLQREHVERLTQELAEARAELDAEFRRSAEWASERDARHGEEISSLRSRLDAAERERDDARQMFESAEHQRAVLASRLSGLGAAVGKLPRYNVYGLGRADQCIELSAVERLIQEATKP